MSDLVLDHIGILVTDLDRAAMEFGRVTGATEATSRFDDPGLTVSVRFLRDGSGTVFELIAPLGENSVIGTALRKNTNIINQLAYRTASIEQAASALKQQGFLTLGQPTPAVAFGGGIVLFLMSPMGFVLELIEAPGHRHQFFPFDTNHSFNPQAGSARRPKRSRR